MIRIRGVSGRVISISAGPAGVSVPCGFTASGLQILAAPLAEEKLLRVARMYEKATDWHTRRPKLI